MILNFSPTSASVSCICVYYRGPSPLVAVWKAASRADVYSLAACFAILRLEPLLARRAAGLPFLSPSATFLDYPPISTLYTSFSNPHALFLTNTELKPLDSNDNSIFSLDLRCPCCELFSKWWRFCIYLL